MLIGYPPPALSSAALTNASWLTSDAGANLTDGQPARVSRIQTTGTPSVTLTFAAAFKPRLIALLGLGGDLQAGDIISATTGAGAALGGNAASQSVVALPDGSLAAWIVTGGTVSTSTVKITLARTGTLDLGEAVALPVVDIPHQSDWTVEVIDPSESQRTRGQQVVTRQRRAYRRMQFAPTPAALADVRGGGLGGMDWQTLQAVVQGDVRVAAVPRWSTAGGAIDAAELHRTAIYGIARPGGIAHLRGPMYGPAGGWSVEEVPPA